MIGTRITLLSLITSPDFYSTRGMPIKTIKSHHPILVENGESIIGA